MTLDLFSTIGSAAYEVSHTTLQDRSFNLTTEPPLTQYLNLRGCSLAFSLHHNESGKTEPLSQGAGRADNTTIYEAMRPENRVIMGGVDVALL